MEIIEKNKSLKKITNKLVKYSYKQNMSIKEMYTKQKGHKV